MGWFKRKKPVVEKVVEDEETITPRLTFELTADGNNIMVGCLWREPKTSEEAAHLVAAFSNMMFLAMNGRLTQTVKDAIGNYNPDNQLATEIGRGILNSFNALMAKNNYLETERPLVTPQEAFSVRGRVDD